MKWLLNVKGCGIFFYPPFPSSSSSLVDSNFFWWRKHLENSRMLRAWCCWGHKWTRKKCGKINILFYRFNGWKSIVYSSHRHMTLLWNEKCEPFVMDNLEYFTKTIRTETIMKCVMSHERTEKVLGNSEKRTKNEPFFHSILKSVCCWLIKITWRESNLRCTFSFVDKFAWTNPIVVNTTIYSIFIFFESFSSSHKTIAVGNWQRSNRKTIISQMKWKIYFYYTRHQQTYLLQTIRTKKFRILDAQTNVNNIQPLSLLPFAIRIIWSFFYCFLLWSGVVFANDSVLILKR